MTVLAVALWVILGALEVRHELREMRTPEPTAAAIRQSFDTPTQWGEES